MDILNLVKSKDDLNEINNNALLRKGLTSFAFLILDYGFEKATVLNIGRESFLRFKNNSKTVELNYESGCLPRLRFFNYEIEKNIELILPELKKIYSLHNFPFHYKIKETINKPFESSNDYIRAISNIWDKNQKLILQEAEKCIETLSAVMKQKITKLLELKEGRRQYSKLAKTYK